MGDFRTKVDYSNRQIKQFKETETSLSGSTVFGTPFSGLTSGVDVGSISTTLTLTNITSTFTTISGTSTTYEFGDDRMDVGLSTLNVISDSNSGTTQTGYGFEGYNSIEIDGNTIYTDYTGSTYDLYVTNIEEISHEVFTGTCQSDLVTLMSGSSLDYAERMIWVDVKGITKTEKLILEREPEVITGTTSVLARDVGGDVVQINVNDLGGDKHYKYNQGLPTTVWYITHNLNKYPSVIVIDEGDGNIQEGHIEYVDSNNIILTFSIPLSGDAIFN